MIRAWSQGLFHSPDLMPPARAVISLHVEDTIAAFLAGVGTAEGKALAGLLNSTADVGDRAAIAAASARLTECDDIQLASCVTPGAVAIPVALAFSASGDESNFHRAIHAGYAAGIQLGKAIGGAHAMSAGCWPTLFIAPVMAAVTASFARGATANTLSHAIALALATSAARIGRPVQSPSGRWYLLADAVSRGIRAAHAASLGFHGDLALLTVPWLCAQTGYGGANLSFLESSFDSDCLTCVGFKPFPTARQGANAILAFQQLMHEIQSPSQIERIRVSVPALHLPLLTRPVASSDRLSTFSNVAYQIACAAMSPDELYDVDRSAAPGPELLAFAQRVSVVADAELDSLLPDAWGAEVSVTLNGRTLNSKIIQSEFDRHSAGLRPLLLDKWKRLLSQPDCAALAQIAKNLHEPIACKSAWSLMEQRLAQASDPQHPVSD